MNYAWREQLLNELRILIEYLYFSSVITITAMVASNAQLIQTTGQRRDLFLPVVGGLPLVGDGGVVNVGRVEPLELPVVVVTHVVPHILLLGPVHISGLARKPKMTIVIELLLY